MKNTEFQVFNYGDFKIHLLEGHIQLFPIIEYEDRLLLMDGGCRCDYSLVADYIRTKIKKKISSTKLIIASHCHPDHSGAVAFFKKNHNIKVAAPEGINNWYSHLSGFVQHKIDTCLAYYVARAHSRPFEFLHFPRKVKYDFCLQSGDVLPFFEDWKAFSCKGHTTHDVVFYNEDKKILYAADVILKVKNNIFLPIPTTYPHLMKKSLDFLETLEIRDIFMAHGGYISGEKLHKAIPALKKQADFISMGGMPGGIMHKLTRITSEAKKSFK